jgi:mRNA interferase MazF
MPSGLRRGEIYRVRQPQHGDPKKSRRFAVVSRQDLLDSKASRVLCAPINASGVGLSTEVQVGVDEGLKHNSVIDDDPDADILGLT